MRSIVIILLTVLLLGGCASTSTENIKPPQDNTMAYLEMKKGQLYLSLYQAKTKSDSKSTAIDGKDRTYVDYSLFPIRDGYAVYTEYAKANKEGKAVGDGTVSMTEGGSLKSQIAFYDKNLQYKHNMDLTPIFKGENIPIGTGFVSMDETGKMLAVAGTSNGFGIYDIKNKKWMDIGNPLKDSQQCFDVAFMKNGKLYCLVTGVNMDLGIGVYDVAKRSFVLEKIKEVPGIVEHPTTKLFHSDDWLYLNDSEDPLQGLPASGKVIVMDTNKMQTKTLSVDGEESSFSRITPDDKYMVSLLRKVDKNGKITHVHVNVYNIKTMDVIKDDTIPIDWKISHMYINNKGFLLTSGDQKETKVLYYEL